MSKILAFNWKLNPQTKKQAESLLDFYAKNSAKAKSQVVVCPPFEYLFDFSRHLKSDIRYLNLGSQDCFWENIGPYTGTVSPLNLKLSGIDYVILGHSERRILLGETDAMVNKKILAAINSGIKPIICFGENIDAHEKGKAAVKKFIKKQALDNLKDLNSFSLSQRSNLIFVYEPIWAISNNSGNIADNPSDADETIKFIKELLMTDYGLQIPKVLYGGSVNSKNIAGFLAYPEIDGFLVGRASLDKGEIKKIVEFCEKSS